MVIELLSIILSALKLIIFLKVLLSWFPNINWWNQPFKFISDIAEPVLTPFRKLIPPIGGLDLSPIFAILTISILEETVIRLLAF